MRAPQIALLFLTGIGLGAAVLVLAIVAAAGYAQATGGEAVLPGVFRARFSAENGLPALTFEPGVPGMVLTVFAIALGYLFTIVGIVARSSIRRRDAQR